MQGDTHRQKAYKAGAAMARERLRTESPEDAAALEGVSESDIVVVRGCYDHVEQVLEALEMPHTAIEDHQLARIELRPEQLLVVNCPGTVGGHAIPKIRDLGDRYGESPVAVIFEHGAGEVFHMISHYYLQRTEFRTARHQGAASGYWDEKGMAVPANIMLDIEDLTVADVEAAQTSSRLFSNVIAQKKRKEANRKDSR